MMGEYGGLAFLVGMLLLVAAYEVLRPVRVFSWPDEPAGRYR